MISTSQKAQKMEIQSKIYKKKILLIFLNLRILNFQKECLT